MDVEITGPIEFEIQESSVEVCERYASLSGETMGVSLSALNSPECPVVPRLHVSSRQTL